MTIPRAVPAPEKFTVSRHAPRARHRAMLAIAILAPLIAYALGPASLTGGSTEGLLAFLALVALAASMPLISKPWLLGQGTAEVGPTGLTLRRWGTRQFLPHEEIRAMREKNLHYGAIVHFPGIELELVDGTTIGLTARLTVRDELLERLRKAHQRRVGYDASTLPAALVRGQRTVRAWVEGLRVAGSGAGGHRQPAVPSERLHEVLKDRAAPLGVRVAAAVALTSAGDESARTQVRIAEGKAGEPALRDALAAVLAEDEARLEAALAEMTEEPRHVSRIGVEVEREPSS